MISRTTRIPKCGRGQSEILWLKLEEMATEALTDLYKITIMQWERIDWMQADLDIDERRIGFFTRELLCLLSCMKSLNKFNSALDLPDYVEKITDFS